MRKTLHAIICLLCFATQSFAQSRDITGTVTDKQDGQPIPGITVLIQGSKQGMVTDRAGNFTIKNVSGTVTLQISFLGYITKIVPVAAGVRNVNVALEEDTHSLNEVMVVGALGIQRQAREAGYSQTTVKAAELTQAHPTNIQNGLVGKVSGLNVTSTTSGITADTRITLRGIRSLTGNNQALLVVDGIAVNLDYINSINPNDVESLNILKGANASALYGPEGVNGVILITTKRGTPNRAPEINVGQTTFFESIAYMPKLQTMFGSGSAYDQFGDGTFDPIENQNWGLKLNGELVGIGRPDENGETQMVTLIDRSDEKRKFFDTGVTNQTDFSLRGGDQNSSYFTSFQNVNVKGVMPGDESKRRTFRLNADRKFGILKVASTISYANRSIDRTTSSSSIYNEVINTPTEVPLTDYKDYVNNKWADHNHFYNDYYPNPYEEIDRNRTKERRDQLIGNVTLTLNPTSWLQIIERPSLTINNSTSKATVGAIVYSPFAKATIYQARNDKTASVADSSSFNSRFQNEFIGTVDKHVGDFAIKLLAGNLIQMNYVKNLANSGNNLGIPTLFNVNNYTGIPGVNEATYQSRLFSIYGSAGLGYKNFAFIEFTGRNDWDSRLNLDNYSYFYPGVNASLVLSDAIPMLKSKALNFLKIRGSWNRTGNVNLGNSSNLGAYQLLTPFNKASGYPYGSNSSFTASGTIYTPMIKPETVESYETGIESQFLDNRIGLDLTYYVQKNNDQVIDVSISQSSGFSAYKLNAAGFNNKGFEADLRLVPIRSSRVTWNINLNYALNDSKVTQIYPGLSQLPIANSAYAIVGYPAFVHRLTDWLRAPDGKVIVDAVTGLPARNSANQIFGRINPKHILGINTDFTYGSFNLRAVAEFRTGNYIYNDIGSSLGFTGNDLLSAINARQRFVFPNSVYSTDGGATYVNNSDVVVNNAHYDFLQASTFRGTQTNYYSSAAFWKLREVALTYTVPRGLLLKSKFVKAATVSLIGRNLIMWRPDSNWWTDPEFANTADNGLGTTTIGQIPPTRSYGFSVNLTF
jgi:TonB-linked SusC/RagA family outer membrane protein